MPLTLSCVSFVNALPYVEGLRALPEGGRPRLLLDPPFRCAERLSRGEVDAALVPSIEFAGMEGAVPAGDLGIASLKEVRSVVLLSRTAPADLRRVAVDSNSRTSVALLRLILARRHGCRPDLVRAEPDPGRMLREHDAALLIGDAALKASHAGLRVMDLAGAWHEMTGLPFVFALWAARTREAALQAGAILDRGLSLGMERLEEAPPSEGPAREILDAQTLRDYLTRNIHFRLGVEEKESLELFFRLCRQEGILEGAVPA